MSFVNPTPDSELDTETAQLRKAGGQRRAEKEEQLKTEVYYRGFAYNVRSQFGIDSLKRAIARDGNE